LGECLLAEGESLLVFAELSVVPADVVEGIDLPGRVVSGPVQA
jgi:hypothetical protein